MPIHGIHAISLLSQCHHLSKLGNWRCDYDPRLPPTAGAGLVQLVVERDRNPSPEHRVFGSNDKYPIHVFGHTWRRDWAGEKSCPDFQPFSHANTIFYQASNKSVTVHCFADVTPPSSFCSPSH